MPTNGMLGTYVTAGRVSFTCSCFGLVGGGGPASTRLVDEMQGCKLSFAPGQFNASCAGTMNDKLWDIRMWPTTKPTCTVTGTPACTMSVTGSVEKAATNPINCTSLAGTITGHARFLAGNIPPRPNWNVVGTIAIQTTFTLNGGQVTLASGSKNVICK